MNGKSSDAMMDLLKELALLKKLDVKSENAAPSSLVEVSELEISEFEHRKNRRQEITGQIKALAEPTGN